MGQVSTFTVTDQQATPVVHNFTPALLDAGYVLWEEQDVSEYIGRYKVVAELRRPKGASNNGANRNIKIHVRFETPVLETLSNDTSTGIAPSATIAYRPMVECIFTLPERCTKIDRATLREGMREVLFKGNIRDLVDDYGVPY